MIIPSRARVALVAAPLALGVLLTGCQSAQPTTPGSSTTSGVKATPTPTVTYPYTPAATPTIMPAGALKKPSTGGPTLGPTAGGPLNGKIIVVDPGHNGEYNPGLNNRKVPSAFGPFQCMATGTETDDRKVSEHQLNWEVSEKLTTLLRERGATVVLTRPNDNGVGPCNADRADIANAAKADFLISVHTDGERMGRNGIADPQGFHVQLDTKMVGGKAVYQRSLAAAENIVRQMTALSGEPLTNYVPRKPAGVWQRTAELTVLAGLKLPGVLVEMGNLKNPANLARLTDPASQQKIAEALAAAIEDSLLKPEYLTPAPEPTASATSAAHSATSATAKPSA